MKILILIFFSKKIKESKITRGHNYTLVKKQSRLDVRKYSFSQRTINVWNNLSTDCVQARLVLKCGLAHLNANANARDESNANANASAQHLNQMQMQMQMRSS